jgi:hypothetical protein
MSDADRLVQVAADALEASDRHSAPDYQVEARAVTVRLLRELAADEYALICERTDGLYALTVNLHALADEIEGKSDV